MENTGENNEKYKDGGCLNDRILMEYIIDSLEIYINSCYFLREMPAQFSSRSRTHAAESPFVLNWKLS